MGGGALVRKSWSRALTRWTGGALVVVLVAASLTAVALTSGSAPAGAVSEITERVSLDVNDNQVVGVNAEAGVPAISADGRSVTFSSYDPFAPEDTGQFGDLYVRDRQTGTTELVSATPSGASGNESSGPGSISADGRSVAFWSMASDLVATDTNGFYDVFLRDRVSGTTQIISLDQSGNQAPYGKQMVSPVISADGLHVAFVTDAQLDPADTDAALDVYVRDLDTNTTRWVSVTPGGVGAGADTREPSISADGSYIAFRSNTTNLVAGVSDYQVYRWDRSSGDFTVVSVDEAGTPGTGGSFAPSISANGARVAFLSAAEDLVPGDENGVDDVYVRDLVDGATLRVSNAVTGETDAHSAPPVISADGLWVAFASQASNLVVADTNNVGDVFRYHLTDGEIDRVSLGANGVQGNGPAASEVGISADGSKVAFSSSSTNLVVPDANNGVADVYVRDLTVPDPPDLTAPTITLSSPADGAIYTQGDGVEAIYSCDDGTGSGVNTCEGDVPSGQALDTASIGTFTFTVDATDNSGNPASATATYQVIPPPPPDTDAPVITINTPGDSGIYGQGTLVVADYSCDDGGGSGVATCSGDVANGAPVDTSILGNQTFTVTATDNAGNSTSTTVSYLVMDIADTTAPELRELGLGASWVDTTFDDGFVDVSALWFDPSPALAPPVSASVMFRSPSGAESITVNLVYAGDGGPGEHYLGGVLVLPAGSELGTWTVDGATATDGFGNTGSATALDVQLLGTSYKFDNVIATAPLDDYDGIAAAVEDAGPNGGDNNFDGIPDSWQPNVATFPNARDGQYMSIMSQSGTTLRNVASVAAAPENQTVLPVGLLEYEVHGLGESTAAEVYVFLPLGQQAWTVEKDQGGVVTPIPFGVGPDGFFATNGGVVTLVMQDGGAFDADGQQNGVFVDPLRLSRPNNPPQLFLFQQPPTPLPATTLFTNPGVSKALLANAFDADGDPLTFSNTAPAHGTVTGLWTYTPAPGFIGDDAFTVSVSDGYSTTTLAIEVHVVVPPTVTCTDDTIKMTANGSIFLASPGLSPVGRCTASDGSFVQFTPPFGASHGSIRGSFQYFPNRDYVGQDTVYNNVTTATGGVGQLRTFIDVIGTSLSPTSGPAGSSFDVSFYCKGLATVAVVSPGPVVQTSAAQTAVGDVTFSLTLPTDVPAGDLKVTGACDAAYRGYGGYLGNGAYTGYNAYNGYAAAGSALPPVTFTVTAPPNDGDGVTEPPTYDGNGDGTPDTLQPDVTSVDAPTGAGLVTIEAPDATYSLQNIETSVPESLPQGVTAPIGIIGFDVILPSGVTTADVVLYLPAGVVIDTVLKDLNGTIVDFTSHSTIDLPNRTVTLHLVDGGAGDADGVVNGVIADPVILGTSYSFRGFTEPINAAKLNVAKAGLMVPVVWRVLDGSGKPISDPKSFVGITSAVGACGTAKTDQVEFYVPWDFSLRYLGNGYWTVPWKTSKAWAGTCRTMTLQLADGVGNRTAVFRFK